MPVSMTYISSSILFVSTNESDDDILTVITSYDFENLTAFDSKLIITCCNLS